MSPPIFQLNNVLENEAGENGVPYLQFIINPNSFAQTVENMFYFSFLVKEGKAAIEIDDTKESENYGDAIACQFLSPPGARDLSLH